MILSHFSASPFKLDPSRKYSLKVDMKPRGLWLSDESQDESWSAWCRAENFYLGNLAHRQDFDLDTTRVKLLQSPQDILDFSREFNVRAPWEDESGCPRLFHFLDWPEIASRWAGLVITPYIWECRLRVMWYYGFDCASACIWDLSCLSPCENHRP